MTTQAPVLRLGIAGLGQAGAMLLPAALRHPGIEVTAGADPRPEAREAFVDSFDAEIFVSVEALAVSGAADIVYIATPTHLHAGHALAALRRGKHVIIEKPMAVSMEDAQAMVAAAEENGVFLIAGHSQSFEPPVRAMREAVVTGRIGQLRMMNTWCFTDWMYRPRLPAELDAALGGGAMFRQGAHQVDILRWIGGGMVQSVRAASGAWDAARRADGSHTLFLEFEDGTVATAVYSGYDHFHSRELTFGIAEDGRVDASRTPGQARRALSEVGDVAGKLALGAGRAIGAPPEHASFFGLTIVSGERGDLRQSPTGLAVYDDGGVSAIPIAPEPTGRDVLLDEAYAAVINHVPPAHDGRWGMANLEVCIAAIQSAREHREVFLQHQAPTPG